MTAVRLGPYYNSANSDSLSDFYSDQMGLQSSISLFLSRTAKQRLIASNNIMLPTCSWKDIFGSFTKCMILYGVVMNSVLRTIGQP